MNDPEQEARRRRIRELMAIPERERTDAQWDELNELEIMMAVTNGQAMPRAHPPGGQGGRHKPGGGGGPGGRKFHNRPRRGGGGGGRPPGR
jgi:hypothetical protein